MIPLEARIGYKFRNSLLMAEALTHSSLRHETKTSHFDNQRLEFLGDAVLELVFTEHLYRIFPTYTEGQLTKLRARLVSKSGLKRQADAIELGAYLMMGRGEEANGGRVRDSIIADAFEALIGAIYLDSNLETARRIILEGAMPLVEECRLAPLDHNPKGQLQEILQALSSHGPTYELLQVTGPEHRKEFTSRIIWHGQELGRGTGTSKKLSETAAAYNALMGESWKEVPLGDNVTAI